MGQTVRVAAFRSRFHAGVLAIVRENVALDWTGSSLSDEVLQVRCARCGVLRPVLRVCADPRHCDWPAKQLLCSAHPRVAAPCPAQPSHLFNAQ